MLVQSRSDRRYLAILLGLLLTLTACESLQQQPVYNTGQEATLTLPQQIDYWLEQARKSPEPQASSARLKASDLLFQNEQFVRSRTVLERIDQQTLNRSEKLDYTLLSAEFARLDEQAAVVIKLLETNQLAGSLDYAEPGHLVRAANLRAWALAQQGDFLSAAREQAVTLPLADDQVRRQAMADSIWAKLAPIDTEQLLNAANKEPDSAVRGWLTLALLQKTHAGDMFRLRDQVLVWQQEWPDHSAAEQLPTALQGVLAIDDNIPKRVTLLLPTSGKLEQAGAAIRTGFLAAYYDTNQAGGMTLSFVDTAAYERFSEAYEAALQTAPDMIVGPLRKSEIAALEHLVTPEGPTVLALNYSDSDEAKSFYQFGLSAADEVRQIAHLFDLQSNMRAMIIRPASAWGQKVAHAFKEEWSALGFNILDEVSYSKADNLSALMKEALLVDRSEWRKNRVQNLIQEPLELVPRRRKDIDLFLLIARPQEARSIKPMLAFHYAGDVPVYSTSQVFAGEIQRHRDRDLNNIVFTETPWMLDSQTPLREQISNLSPSNPAYARMHAFGVDAFQLTLRLGYLAALNTASYDGASGRLMLAGNRKIRRELDLARFVAGKPRRFEPPSPAQEEAGSGTPLHEP